ncbi:transposase [Fusobacterium sp. THCT1E1]
MNNRYSKEFKSAVAKRYLEENGGYLTVTKEMDVKNDSQVAAWIKKFKLLGETAFDFETCGKVKGPIKGKPKTKFNSLEEEVDYLRMENEY